MRIIVVNPPLASPAAAPCAPLRVRAMLTGLEPLGLWDANLDYWRERLLPGPGEEAAALLGGEAFFDPDAYVQARRALRERLEVLSAEVAPGRYTWEGLEHPASLDSESSLAWAKEEDNPLTAFLAAGLSERLPAGSPALALITLENPGQWLGALCAGAWLKQHRPDCVIALVGDCLEQAGAPGGGGQAWDHALPLLYPDPLRSLAAELCGAQPAEGCVLRDLEPLPGQYLLPAQVMSLRPVLGMDLELHDWREQSIAVPRLMPPAPLAQGLSRQAERGAAGFLSLRQEMSAAYLAELAPAIKDNQTPLGLAASLDDPPGEELFKELAAGGLRLLQWRAEASAALDPERRLARMERTLALSARAGLWNHLVLPAEASDPLAAGLLDFTGSNPQVVHSWSRPALWPWSPRPRQIIGEPQARAYRQVPPLPGRPLWRFMAEPAHLLLYLQRHGCRRLVRWRVRDGGGVHALGENLNYVFARPEEIDPKRLEEIALLVLAAGKVKPKWVRHNLAHAYLVSYVEEDGVIVGTDTLKRPRPEYIERIKKQSGVDLTGYTERGYISVRPEYRALGVGNQLIQGLVARSEGRKMVIITGADNIAGQRILARNGQRLVKTYFSLRLQKDMQLWMPREQDPEMGEEAWP
ncbi:MAG: hypothetical protein KQH53_02905 [Desulfarculaceae bacterium]|nr:hypothetical protein [Desulfarculaceae bacterium]